MGLLQDLATAKLKQYFGIPTPGSSQAFLDWQGSQDYKSRSTYAQYEGIVYACVNAIAQSIAAAEWRMYRINAAGDKVPVESHRFLQLLNNPHKGFSKFELIYGTGAFYELGGEAFWYFATGELTGLPKEVYLMHPSRVRVMVNKETGEVMGYKYLRNGADDIPLDLNEVLPFITFNPDNPYRGKGTVQAAMGYIETEKFTTNFTKNFFKNNATPRGIVNVDTTAVDEFKKFKEKWRQQYGSSDNAGKVAFLRGQDVKFTQLSMGLSDIDMEALRRLTEDSILRMFRIPRALLGFTDDTGLGRASVETLEYIYSKYNIEFKLKQIDDVLQMAIDRFWPGQGLFIEHINTVPEDREAVLNEQKALVDIAISRNEVRKTRNLEEVQGGDILYHNATQTPVEGSDQPINAARKGAKKGGKIGTIKIVRKTVDETPREEKFRLELMAVQESYEKIFDKAVDKFLDKQKAKVLDQIVPKKVYDTVFQTDTENADLVAALEPIITQLTLETGKIAITFATDEELEFQFTEALKNAITESLGRMAAHFNQDTLDQLAATLTEGVKEGESLAKLQKRVEEVYSDAKGYRSERIARTETLKGSNHATMEAYKQTGFITKKVWYTNPGACEFCNAMNGKVVGLDQSFKEVGDSVDGTEGGTYAINYDTIDTPPLHPNCRCTIVPYIEK